MKRTATAISIALAAAITMTGCASPQERAAKLVEKLGPYCEGLGYKKDTDPWRACIQAEYARITKSAP